MILFKLLLFSINCPQLAKELFYYPALSEKVAAADAKWIFKLAVSDISLDHMSKYISEHV